MGMKKSMTRNGNHDDASSRERSKMWSDLNHDLLTLVMMQLRVIDFVVFSGVCKSWRSFALCNEKRFMASRPPTPPVPPMVMQISSRAYNKKCYVHLEDFEGRKFKKTLLPCSVERVYVGSTCGYLILFGRRTHDFWLVNPITRHGLYFPNVPIYGHDNPSTIKAIIVFSPSISRKVFIILDKVTHEIWFSIAGKGKWNLVDTFPILDLHVFKGKIYTLDKDCCLFEMRLGPDTYLKSLDIENYWEPKFVCPEFVNSGENLYVVDRSLQYRVEELDFGKMTWVTPKKTYALFISNLNYPLAVNPVTWVDPPSQIPIQRYAHRARIYELSGASRWYFPDCSLKDNLLNE